jgi:hypothetical protein
MSGCVKYAALTIDVKSGSALDRQLQYRLATQPRT